LGLAYVSDPPSFQGRLFACTPTPSGREYVRIVDEHAGQFTLIPKPPGAEQMQRRMVNIARDHEGRPAIRLGPEISR